MELAALECLEKFPQTYNIRNVVTALAPLFLNISSSFLPVCLDDFEFRPDAITDYGVSYNV